MSEADIDLTHKRLPISPDDEGRTHQWGAAPPGAGRGKTCRVCGQRQALVRDLPCPGAHSSAVTETQHAYDPFS